MERFCCLAPCLRDLSWWCERNVKSINGTMRGPGTRTNPAPGGGQSYTNQNGVGVLMSPWIYESGFPNSLKSEQSVGNSVPWMYILCYILRIFFFLNPLWFRFSIICNQKPPSQYREIIWDTGEVLCSGGLGSGLALSNTECECDLKPVLNQVLHSFYTRVKWEH